MRDARVAWRSAIAGSRSRVTSGRSRIPSGRSVPCRWWWGATVRRRRRSMVGRIRGRRCRGSHGRTTGGAATATASAATKTGLSQPLCQPGVIRTLCTLLELLRQVLHFHVAGQSKVGDSLLQLQRPRLKVAVELGALLEVGLDLAVLGQRSLDALQRLLSPLHLRARRPHTLERSLGSLKPRQQRRLLLHRGRHALLELQQRPTPALEHGILALQPLVHELHQHFLALGKLVHLLLRRATLLHQPVQLRQQVHHSLPLRRPRTARPRVHCGHRRLQLPARHGQLAHGVPVLLDLLAHRRVTALSGAHQMAVLVVVCTIACVEIAGRRSVEPTPEPRARPLVLHLLLPQRAGRLIQQ
mmetsp:Transcript_28973/g.94385  ORF Transcript_28973/g.94385 Transcript_28973/m.94385 type:complete len:357 (+) Transcript_28973:724-1794(+)